MEPSSNVKHWFVLILATLVSSADEWNKENILFFLFHGGKGKWVENADSTRLIAAVLKRISVAQKWKWEFWNIVIFRESLQAIGE